MNQIDESQERRKAEPVREARSDYFAAMSHEIRTPMNGILGMAELLLTADDLSDRHRRRVEIIKRSGATLLTMIDHIIDLSRIEAEPPELDASPVDLRELIDTVRSHVQSKTSSGALKLDLVDHLGDHHHVVGDAQRLRKLLTYLLSTATAFANEGTLQIVASAKPTGSETTGLRVEIKATGMDADAIERLLVSMEAVASRTSQSFDEATLGLTICTKLALTMGGKVGADRTAGDGIDLWLNIDLLTRVEHETSEELTSPLSVAGPNSRDDMVRNVLVAEDNPDMALLIEDLLEEAGYRSTIAPDGASVLRILAERHFDVVLMDGRMPDMSGFETTERIRQLPDGRAKVPIIALTAEALAGDRERYLSAGMDDYISKPVDYETLVGTIERCCHERRQGTGVKIDVTTML